MIVLEDDIVVVRQLQEAGRCPLRIMDQQGLRRRRQTPSNELDFISLLHFDPKEEATRHVVS